MKTELAEMVEKLCDAAEETSNSYAADTLWSASGILEKIQKALEGDWRSATCGECGYWSDRQEIVLVDGNPVDWIEGCKNGHRPSSCKACPDLVLREVPE